MNKSLDFDLSKNIYRRNIQDKMLENNIKNEDVAFDKYKVIDNDSFDYIPKKEVIPYKYYSPVPKKKCERKKLEAYTCPQCEKYYSTFSNERVQISSRHRGNKRPPTPEHFWDLDFPNIEIKTENYKMKPLSKNKYYKESEMKKL